MLPASEGWQHLHPLSPVVRIGRYAWAGAVLLVTQWSELLVNPWLAVLAAPVLLAVIAAYGVMAWLYTGYRLLDDQLELKTGVVSRQYRRLPLARVEAADISRPWLARLAGVSELRVEAASQGDSEIKLQYLSQTEAHSLREELLRRRQGEVGSSSNVDEMVEAASEQPIAKVALKDLLAGYVFGPAAVAVTLIIAATIVAGRIGVGEATTFFTGSLLALAVVAMGVARNIESFYGFTVSSDGDGLVIRRGLLNTTNQKVPLGRLQAIRITEPFWWRLFGRAALAVDIAGYGQDFKGVENSVLLPIGDRRSADRLLAQLISTATFSDAQLVSGPARSRARTLLWRRYGVGTFDDHVMTRSGLFRRETFIVPHVKLQSLRTSQGPWQRRLRLATVHFDTVGRVVVAAAVHRDEAEARRLVQSARAGLSRGLAKDGTPVIGQ